MFKQDLTLISGLLVVEFGLIQYPIREFQIASATSFSLEYFIYPAVCIVFVLRFPNHKTIWHKIGWFALFPTSMTILELLIERYTKLIDYINWTWYYSWFSMLIFDIITLNYYLWFIKKKDRNYIDFLKIHQPHYTHTMHKTRKKKRPMHASNESEVLFLFWSWIHPISRLVSSRSVINPGGLIDLTSLFMYFRFYAYFIPAGFILFLSPEPVKNEHFKLNGSVVIKELYKKIDYQLISNRNN
jgi:hypothetical protein